MISNNNQKIEFREFHINNFPVDRIFVSLEENFHRKLFTKLRGYKFKEFNNYFFNNNLNWSTFKQWKNQNHFIPLWFIIEISIRFPEFSILNFEKNIASYKGPSTSAIIKNPNLPLKEDSRLLKIVAHLIGDGSVGGGFGSKLLKGKQHSEYRNFTSGLLDSFEKDLSVFGEVPATKNYKHGSLIIPNSIGYILEQIYQIKFDTFNSRVPKDLFNLPREVVASFLRAFADDEGHVFDSSIEYYSNNKYLLTDILILMNRVFPEINTSGIKLNTKAGKNIKYYFKIYNDSQEEYLNLIGFDHKQKREDIIFNINRTGNRNKNPKDKISNLLKNNKLTAKQISRIIGIRHSSVLEHLNELREVRKVEIVKKEHWTNYWTKKF